MALLVARARNRGNHSLAMLAVLLAVFCGVPTDSFRAIRVGSSSGNTAAMFLAPLLPPRPLAVPRATRLGSSGRSDDSPGSDGEPVGVPRLHVDVSSLLSWVERSGGRFHAVVDRHVGPEGWGLSAKGAAGAGETLVTVPKACCIFANPAYMTTPLLDTTQQLMTALGPAQWRARLAIALLSERVRAGSQFRAYLRNLPFEFWGVPMFYSSDEFSVMQDLALMQRTRDRCRFLTELVDSVLGPLNNTPRDPFSGHQADINAVGWGFASAASRALRHPDVLLHPDGHVIVPCIDIAQHSPTPTCRVVHDVDGECFRLVTLTPVQPGEPLTIDYGPLSNDELFADYGFTIDNNPHDRIKIT
jgi:hypothetical protein